MANRTGKGGFQKGQSGNPGGRPPEVKGIQQLARAHAPAAITELARLAKAAKSEAARVTACSALLDRGYGRPPQFNTGDADQFRRAIEMSDDELAGIASRSGEGASEAPVDKAQLN